MDAALEIYTLGGVRMLRGGAPVAGLTTRKTEALLIYLASTRRPQPREVLADLFWAEHAQDQALANLRKSLSNLHQVLGDCLTISRSEVSLNPAAPAWLDTIALEDGLKAIHQSGGLNTTTAEQAAWILALYCGQFLEGFTVFDCLEFDQWSVRERERLHRLVVDGLSELVAFETEQQAYQSGMAHAARLLEIDPLNESAHRQMMRLLAGSGQRSAAIGQFETCQKLLEEELGVPPEAETLRLYEQIRAGELGMKESTGGLPGDSALPKTLPEEEEPPAPGTAPFMGLQYFDAKDAGLFFGRSQVTARLVEMVRQHRFLAVIGASGSGKSSVVRAGLIPALRSSPDGAWDIFLLTPTAQPLESLAVCLTRDFDSVSFSATLLDDLQQDSRSLHLFLRKRGAAAEMGNGTKTLLVIDQFEELFTMCRDAAQRQAFIDALMAAAQAAGGPVHVLIALRADFYDHLAEYARLRQAVAQCQEYLGAMSAVELRQAIEEPARLGGWAFAPGLVDLMLHDVGADGDSPPEPGALPLLSHALLETWNHRRGKVMTFNSYAEAGGVHRAIARTAERLYTQELSPAQQEIARNIFLRLTELGEGTQDTRRRASLRELFPMAVYGDPKDVEEVLIKLADARLIITGEGTVEVAHEALIREWPTLREWLAQDREGLLVQRRLTEAAQEWELLERDAGALFRGARLSQAVEWAKANPHQLNEQEQAFLGASQLLSEKEEAEKEAARQRELQAAQRLAEEQSRSAKRLRKRAAYLVTALVAAVILAGAAVWLGLQSAAAARLASSRELTAAALANVKIDPQLSAHLALNALEKQYTFEAENALHKVVPEMNLMNITPITKDAKQYWWARDAALFAAGTPNGIEVIDFAHEKRFVVKAGENCLGVNPSTDGRFLVTYCIPDGSTDPSKVQMQVVETASEKVLFTVPKYKANANSGYVIPPTGTNPAMIHVNFTDITTHVWDIPSGRERLVIRDHDPIIKGTSRKPFVSSRASYDGNRLVSYGSDGQVMLWDLEEGQKLLQFDARSLEIYCTEFSPDGTRLATAGGDQTVKVWDITSIAQEPRLVHSFKIESGSERLAFSLDGTMLAVGGENGQISVFDVQAGKLLRSLMGHTAFIQTVAFSKDGKRLYSTSHDNTIREWDLSTAHEDLVLNGPKYGLCDVAYRPGEEQVATGGGGEMTLWDSRSGKMLRSWNVPGMRFEIAWDPGGKRLASAGDDHTARIWEAATGRLLMEFPKQTGQLWGVAWSPDGSRLVTTSDDEIITVWDPASGKQVMAMANSVAAVQDQKTIYSVVFTPDGRKMITGTFHNTVTVWDAATGKELDTKLTGGNVWGLAISQDGKRLASGLDNGQVVLWRLTGSGLEQEKVFTSGQMGILLTVALSPDGKLLAAGDIGGNIRVWDLSAGRERLVFQGHSAFVTRVTFSPDSRRLVSTGLDGSARFYVLPIDDLIALARSRLFRPLTAEECWTYLHTDTCPASP